MIAINRITMITAMVMNMVNQLQRGVLVPAISAPSVTGLPQALHITAFSFSSFPQSRQNIGVDLGRWFSEWLRVFGQRWHGASPKHS